MYVCSFELALAQQRQERREISWGEGMKAMTGIRFCCCDVCMNHRDTGKDEEVVGVEEDEGERRGGAGGGSGGGGRGGIRDNDDSNGDDE